MGKDQTTVHHAIIDLYEVEDEEAVTASDVSAHTAMQLSDVNAAMNALENAGVITRNDAGVVVEAKNNGYFPLA